MALNKALLASSIKNAFDEASDKSIDPAQARDDIAKAIADAVDIYIRAGIVNVTVATTGTAVAQTGTGVGTIS